MQVVKSIMFNPRLKKEQGKIRELLAKRNAVYAVDAFEHQLEELFLSRNPKLKLNPRLAKIQAKEFFKTLTRKNPLWEQGRWVYFEWNNILVHILDEEDFSELRTSRNHNLITKEEQEMLRNFRIGIAGLSVGNSAALTLALEGFETMRLADFDDLSLSNLNRIRGSVAQLGINKTTLTARQIYEINPYAKLELFQKGITDEKLLKKFVVGPPKLDVLIDETDDGIMKIHLRLLARRLQIPVLSAADNGDNAIVDIERFDLEPRRRIYHGAIGTFEPRGVNRLPFAEKMQLLSKIVGIEFVTSKMKQSFLKVGRTLYAWPQLGGAAMLSGGTIAYLVKKIALNEKLSSGKYDVNLDRIFDTQHDSIASRNKRERETKEFLKRQNHIFS